MLSIFKCFIRR